MLLARAPSPRAFARPAVVLAIALATRMATAAPLDEAAHGRALEAALADPAAASDGARLDGLARAADALAAGVLRDRTDRFVAEAFAREPTTEPRARHHLSRLAREAGDASVKRLAQGRLVDLALARGDAAEASRVARESGDAGLLRRARIATWRREAVGAALGAVVAFLGYALALFARAPATLRRNVLRALYTFTPKAALVAGWLGGAGALVARAFGAQSVGPFATLAALTFVLALAARLAALAAPTSPRRRAGRAVFAALAALAAATLALTTLPDGAPRWE